MTDLFDSKGGQIQLGKKIGSGGEGLVYELPVLGSELAAKVYHGNLSVEKQAKLLAMVKVGNAALRKIAAWPLELLYTADGRRIRGFVMPKIADSEPIHHLYSPSHRKLRYPEKDWAFLVYTARNVAAAFEAVHRHGHVIGDVNPNLVFVAQNSVVKLIDCDSFQIGTEGRYYLCEVGVSHFTPPELQNCSSFRGIRRTKNHDTFGLALLLFHLLLMGRHPFSGVFSGAGDMPLDKAIAQCRYAFGSRAEEKGMAPPPKSVTPAILPNEIIELFEKAFAEPQNRVDWRPSALEWLSALDVLKSRLRVCVQNPIHKFFTGLAACPWCTQEKVYGNVFFVSPFSGKTECSGFDLEKIWTDILAVAPPGPVPAIDFSGLGIKSKPLPISDRRIGKISIIKRTGGLIVVAWSLLFAPKFFVVALFTGAYLFFSASDRYAERRAREDALHSARQNLAEVQKQWFQEAGEEKFQKKLAELFDLKTEYENLAENLSKETEKLQQNLHDFQLNNFLGHFFLENFNIPSLGPARKVVLASFGIETAADVNMEKLVKIKGIGERLARELVEWRKSLERHFYFDPAQGVDPTDIAALQRRFMYKRKQLEEGIVSGKDDLSGVCAQIVQKRLHLTPTVQTAMRQVLQAEADLAQYSS